MEAEASALGATVYTVASDVSDTSHCAISVSVLLSACSIFRAVFILFRRKEKKRKEIDKKSKRKTTGHINGHDISGTSEVAF